MSINEGAIVARTGPPPGPPTGCPGTGLAGGAALDRTAGIATTAAAGRKRRLRAVNGANRSDSRRLVARLTGAEQTRHRDGRDDADDRDDDQQLDQRETVVLLDILQDSSP